MISEENVFWDLKVDIYTYKKHMTSLMKKMQAKWFSLLAIHDLADYWPAQIELHQDYNILLIFLQEIDHIKKIEDYMTNRFCNTW